MIEIQRIEESKFHKEFLHKNKILPLNYDELEKTSFAQITHFSFQFHGEHCTECAAPDCHSSCDLFSKGPSGRCRRFCDGIVIKTEPNNPLKYTMEIVFKPWGRMLSLGNSYCVTKRTYKKWYSALIYLGYFWQKSKLLFSFLPNNLLWIISDKITGLGNKLPVLFNRFAQHGMNDSANCLYLLAGNPYPISIRAEIVVSELPATGKNYRRSFNIEPGWHEEIFPIQEIEQVVDPTKRFRITFVPLVSKPTFLQLPYYGFVLLENLNASLNETYSKVINIKQIKLLIIDLDNTLWEGVLIENIEKGMAIKSGLEKVVRTLDQRGILLSIASKNNFDDAKIMLEKLGIWGLFLCPQINWSPKGSNIQTIVRDINIGTDTVAFIDDSAFELEEVSNTIPGIRTYRDTDFINLLTKEEFNPILTADAKNRRKYYQAEMIRNKKVDKADLSYYDFLASCEMKMVLSDIDENNKNRVYELIQRTNQLNFSGKKYSRSQVDSILKKDNALSFVISCYDKFGEYGIVGFVLVNYEKPSLIIEDMMLSCRILGKKVEQAILLYIIKQAIIFSYSSCQCVFYDTKRNTPAKNVLIDFGVEFVREKHRVDIFTPNSKAKDYDSLPLDIIDKSNTLKILQEYSISDNG